MVTVQVANRIYSMPEAKAKGLLEIASEQVPMGIYALRKGKYIELRRDKLSKTKLREARARYKKLGIKVYANGL